MKNAATLVLTASLALTMSAFASDERQKSQSAAGAPVSDPCALLAADEIKAVLGWSVAKTQPKTYGATGSCTYTGPKEWAAPVPEQVSPGFPGA